jgi:hypothetical protein
MSRDCSKPKESGGGGGGGRGNLLIMIWDKVEHETQWLQAGT